MADRREAIKIIGAIGSTCAFPFLGDELYAQHAHSAAAAQAAAGAPRFFAPEQMTLLNRLADLIVPPSETPGGAAAGVPAYIDLVVSKNPDLQRVFVEGIQWLGAGFIDLGEAEQIARLQPLSDAIDSGPPRTPEQRFFRALKNLTADGYYTSKIGLRDELGYTGNTVLAEFPSCDVPEH
jgi:gluconate 2-dehydrogenase gamma chain